MYDPTPRRTTGRVSLVALLGAMATLAILVGSPLGSAATSPNSTFHYTPSEKTETQILQNSELMPAFLNGTVVQTEYDQGYFVGNFSAHNSTFGMEPMDGASAINAPNARPASPTGVDPLYVLVPWWGPASAPYAPAYNPAAYGIQLQCAPASIAVCYDHPATIYVPGLGTVPLPGHDHLIGTTAQGTDEWWGVLVVLVTNSTAYPNLAGTHGITSVNMLRAAQSAGGASASLRTNVYLDFNVVTPGLPDWKVVQVPESPRLGMSETMPTFYNGDVYNSVYEQGYFIGSIASHNMSFGMEPLLQNAQLGVNATRLPAPAVDIEKLFVLVPWWGPSSAPYAPAYNPAAYGIQEECAPASISICFDHPATISVPGLGVVPLPGHDHLVATLAQHVAIWWQVEVVLVLNQSAWPTLDMNDHSGGITSVHELRMAQKAGTASSDLSTNVFLDFQMLGPAAN